MSSVMRVAAAVCLSLVVSPPARASWWDAAWPCRRTVDVVWNADRAVGNEVAQVELYTAGRALPTGADVRVATEDGHPVPCRVLQAGPGDFCRLAFALAKNAKRYAVYFGNPHAPAPADPPEPQSGLLMETRTWTGGRLATIDQLQRAWDRATPDPRRILIDNAFLGHNPFDDRVLVLSKLTGTLSATLDGQYLLAMAVDDDGAVLIDGQPTLMAHLGGGDIRYHTTIHLARGPHRFELYQVNYAGAGYFSVGWQGPGMTKVGVIDKFAFGSLFHGANVTVGPLEVRGQPLVGDFAARRVAECFVADRYQFHYRFTGAAHVSVAVRYTWDFGDGLTGEGTNVDHAYLRPGVYPVRCVAHAGPNADAQTARVWVDRDYAHLPTARDEPPAVLSSIVATYPSDHIAPADLPRAVQLHLAADRLDPAVATAMALAGLPSQPDPAAALAALTGVESALVTADHPETAVTLWDRVPPSAPLRPTAAAHAAGLALWSTGDAARAVALLAPHQARGTADVRRLYAQALLLTGHADQARSLLDGLPTRATGGRRAALSGADARTVEFYITEGEPDAGDGAWDRWMTDFPTDYLTGYAVLLKTKLMELRHRPAAAAAVAEGFADAVPTSSYAPQLLDRAAKLLAASDPARSAALRQRLKQKYPEDPLSQD